MGVKMSGYTCDKCDVLLLTPESTFKLMEIMATLNRVSLDMRKHLKLEHDAIVRIYCPTCAKTKEWAEHTMLLKDVGDVHETRQNIHENNNGE